MAIQQDVIRSGAVPVCRWLGKSATRTAPLLCFYPSRSFMFAAISSFLVLLIFLARSCGIAGERERERGTRTSRRNSLWLRPRRGVELSELTAMLFTLDVLQVAAIVPIVIHRVAVGTTAATFVTASRPSAANWTVLGLHPNRRGRPCEERPHAHARCHF